MKTPRHAPPVVRDGKTLLPAHAVSTAPVTAFGLIGGYLTARETGIRPLGGVVLAAAGLYAGRTWLATRGPAVAGGLAATDPKRVPYGALTATFHTGIGCLVGPSLFYLTVRAIVG